MMLSDKNAGNLVPRPTEIMTIEYPRQYRRARKWQPRLILPPSGASSAVERETYWLF
jgi:hypothetical protein